MSVINTLRRFRFCIGCAALLSSCNVYHAPKGWLPEQGDVAREPFGGWLFIKYNDGGVQRTSEGEFIGFNDETLLLLDEVVLIRVPNSDRNITFASLKINDDDRGAYTLWAVAGILGTPFINGWYSIFTWPFWVVGGPIAASAEYYRGAYISEKPDMAYWRSVAPFSRFPQGIPVDLDVRTLKPKRRDMSPSWRYK